MREKLREIYTHQERKAIPSWLGSQCKAVLLITERKMSSA